MTEIPYAGTELELFQHAVHWKSYWASRISAFLHGDVLEIGSGMGSNTRFLLSRSAPRSWTCVEPDARLFHQLHDIGARSNGCSVHTIHGTVKDIESDLRYDTVLYLDVLEHIEDDAAELAQAAALLRTNGHIVVLAPALSWLYSPFDAAIGHYRRYTKATIQRLSPPACRLVRTEYLDSFGIIASCANRYLLKRAHPTYHQIVTWDRVFVPLSVVLDTLVNRQIGKSLVAVWKRIDAVSE
jgi:SAM-dependent methyltransferase